MTGETAPKPTTTTLEDDSHPSRPNSQHHALLNMPTSSTSSPDAFLPPTPTPPTPPTPLTHSPRERYLGAVLVVVVAFLWVASAALAQAIFGSTGEVSAYLVSYVGVIMRSSLLPALIFRPSWRMTIWRRGVVLQAVAILAPISFFCNWTYYAGLATTSVASSSTLCSSSTLFALIITVLFFGGRISFVNVTATFLTVAGVALIFVDDAQGLTGRSVQGDILSLVAAALFGLYAVVMRAFVDLETEGDAFNVDLFIALSGLQMVVIAWPGLIILDWLNVEKFQWPSIRVAGMLAANSLFGEVVPALLWVRAARMTSPLVTTLATSLMVPMSIAWDVVSNEKQLHSSYILGACCIVSGFMMLSVVSDTTDGVEEQEEEEARREKGEECRDGKDSSLDTIVEEKVVVEVTV